MSKKNPIMKLHSNISVLCEATFHDTKNVAETAE